MPCSPQARRLWLEAFVCSNYTSLACVQMQYMCKRCWVSCSSSSCAREWLFLLRQTIQPLCTSSFRSRTHKPHGHKFATCLWEAAKYAQGQ
eukprot:5372460-Heterocapsa_arctica.AAC.1